MIPQKERTGMGFPPQRVHDRIALTCLSRFKLLTHIGRNPTPTRQTPPREKSNWNTSRLPRLLTPIPSHESFGNLHRPRNSPRICWRHRATICGCGRFQPPSPSQAPTQSPAQQILGTPLQQSFLHWPSSPTRNHRSIRPLSHHWTGIPSPQVSSSPRASTPPAPFGTSRP